MGKLLEAIAAVLFPDQASFDAHAEQNDRFGRSCAADPLAGNLNLTADGNPCVRAHVHRYLTTGLLAPSTASCA